MPLMDSKTSLKAILGKNGDPVRWVYQECTEFMYKFFNLCSLTIRTTSDIEEKARYSKPPSQKKLS